VACASTIITLSSPMMTPEFGIALGGERPRGPRAHFGEADLFLGHVALRREGLGHGSSMSKTGKAT
jgi:hypothetical protein